MSNRNGNSVGKSSAAGSLLSTISTTGPTGLAFDSAGNLYVGNGAAGTISKFDSSGSFVFSWNSVQPNFLLVAPSAVPEPSALLLAFCGLMGAGVAMRRSGRALAAGLLRN